MYESCKEVHKDQRVSECLESGHSDCVQAGLLKTLPTSFC